jgi:hypothetical protein
MQIGVHRLIPLLAALITATGCLARRGLGVEELHYAATEDDVRAVQRHFAAGQSDLIAVLFPEMGTLLHVAAKSGSADVTRWLLQNGASPKIRDGSGARAITYAIRGEHWDVARILAEAMPLPVDRHAALLAEALFCGGLRASRIYVWVDDATPSDSLAATMQEYGIEIRDPASVSWDEDENLLSEETASLSIVHWFSDSEVLLLKIWNAHLFGKVPGFHHIPNRCLRLANYMGHWVVVNEDVDWNEWEQLL